MKKIVFITALIILVILSGCPSFEQNSPVTEIKILIDNTEINTVTIEIGETINLNAQTGLNSADISVIWELDNENAVIISSGAGVNCSLRGMETGQTVLTVKAWRNILETPVVKTISITVIEGQVKDIVLLSPFILGINEEQTLLTEITPEWAGNVNIEWSSESGNIVLDNGKIKGIGAGPALITASIGDFTKIFNIEVKNNDPLTDLSIYNGVNNITGTSILIGLNEEIKLDAVIEPTGRFTWFNWTSDNPENVSVNKNGEIKGIKANSSAVITLSASGLEKQVTISVKNPVTGIRIMYDNTEKLPVNNIIWLSPDEEVKLKVELAPEGINSTITWTGANDEVSVSSNEDNCTLKGLNITRFDMLPTELRITAWNNDNGDKPVTTAIWVKTQVLPVFAWDRARDGGLRNNGIIVTNDTGRDYYTMGSQANDNGLTLPGRGEYNINIPVKISGNPNIARWTKNGILINSSNSSGGTNPNPAINPNNSTRIAIGTNGAISTSAAVHNPGIFNFLEPGGLLRISVDYEIVWTAGAGRNMWITVNNNNANAMFSKLGTSSQLLVQPLTDPRGTRATSVTSLNVDDFTARRIPGYEDLNTAFIGIICLSNGGSIYVTGIRIERED